MGVNDNHHGCMRVPRGHPKWTPGVRNKFQVKKIFTTKTHTLIKRSIWRSAWDHAWFMVENAYETNPLIWPLLQRILVLPSWCSRRGRRAPGRRRRPACPSSSGRSRPWHLSGPLLQKQGWGSGFGLINRIRGSVPQTDGDFKMSIEWIF